MPSRGERGETVAILIRETYENPVPFEGDVRIGVCHFLEPSFLHGYYFVPGMDDVKFCDTPKRLPNDVIWITNQPFDPQQAAGVYIKNKYFLRIPYDKIMQEVAMDLKDNSDKIKRLAYILQTMIGTKEAQYLRYALSMPHAVNNVLSVKSSHDHWNTIGVEALSYFWKGSVKHASLYGGSFMAPRLDTVRQLAQIPVPNFTLPPLVVKQVMSGEVLRQFLLSAHGFVRLSIESVDRSIQEFVDLERTLWTTYEALWLLDRANITCRTAYVSQETIQHPLRESGYLDSCASYSWADGLRSEILYLGAAYGQPTYQAWFRANAHIAMAYCAEKLASNGIACIGLSLNKIKVGFKESERILYREIARENGFLFLEEELPGADFLKEKI